MAEKLRDLRFVDLYVGEDFADVKGLPGRHAAREELPPEYAAEVEAVRAKCLATYAGDERQFSIIHDEVMYRVTVMASMRPDADPRFVLRRMAAGIRDFSRLGLHEEVENLLLAADTTGLILLVGEQGVGKTSTAASLLTARLASHGGVGVAIEDPPETQLDGVHGNGRCIQVPVLRRFGGYAAQLPDVMRAGASMLLIGEILDGTVAKEAALHSVNGMLVISTMHAKSPSDALSRLAGFAPDMLSVIANGVAAVVHQSVERSGDLVRVVFETLLVPGPDEGAIRTAIAEAAWSRVGSFVEMQSKRMSA